MKTVSIFELPEKRISLVLQDAIRQAPPQWNTLTMRQRRLDGLVYVEQGAIRYMLDNGEHITVPRHGLIYLPVGSAYRSEITETPFALIRLSYIMTDTEDGEQIRIFDRPFLITDDAEELERPLQSLLYASAHPEQNFYSLSLLSTVLDWLQRRFRHRQQSRIAPALALLQGHYKEALTVSELARSCHMSEPQFFRVFQKETRETPIGYRDRLRLSEAKKLLSSGEHSVSEVAELCGFESVYYFSRFFKKHEKKTPGAYRASQKQDSLGSGF